jgi:hypothetical protein
MPKVCSSVVMSVCLSVCIRPQGTGSTATGRIIMKFEFGEFLFENLSRKIKLLLLKYDKNYRRFTRRPVHIYDISLDYS